MTMIDLKQEIKEIIKNPDNYERDINDMLELFKKCAIEIIGDIQPEIINGVEYIRFEDYQEIKNKIESIEK